MLVKASDGLRRYVLCDFCLKGFTVTATAFQSSVDYICPNCEQKQFKLYLLREELRSAAHFGHTTGECELCGIQNQIDDLLTGGYDWREDRERRESNSAVGHNL
jgi:hypothetical protein